MAKKTKKLERPDFIKIKNDKMTLEERIYALPPYTYDFSENRKYQLKKANLWDKYEQEFVLLTDKRLSDSCMCEECGEVDNNTRIENYVGEFTKEKRDEYLDDRFIRFAKRSHVEYTPYNLQVVTGCIITSPSFVAVLKATSGRLKDKLTLIQGHVEYEPSYPLTRNIMNTIRLNAFKELSEEVKIKGCDIADCGEMSEEPKFIVDKYTTLVDCEHVGFIYEFKMSDEDVLKLKSNEKDKHETFIINKETLLCEETDKKEYNFDSWLSDIIKMIEF